MSDTWLVPCPVCLGLGGYLPDGSPMNPSSSRDVRKCVYCKGERRVVLPSWLYDGPPMKGLR